MAAMNETCLLEDEITRDEQEINWLESHQASPDINLHTLALCVLEYCLSLLQLYGIRYLNDTIDFYCVENILWWLYLISFNDRKLYSTLRLMHN